MKKTLCVLLATLMMGCTAKPIVRPSNEKSALTTAEPKCTRMDQKEYVLGIFEQAVKYNVDLIGKPLEDVLATEPCRENLETIIPDYLKEKQNWEFVLDKDTHIGSLFHQGEDGVYLIEQFRIVTGGWNYVHKKPCDEKHSKCTMKFWPTPNGTYYINRINIEPFYYHPAWSETKGKVIPGRNSPYGLVMMELCTAPGSSDYGFNPPGDSSINLHSTKEMKRKGRESHGCIRGDPPYMEVIGSSIVFNFTDGKYRGNGRARKIYLLNTPIKVHILGSDINPIKKTELDYR